MRVVVSSPGAPWLPDGGRADVLLAEPGDAPLDPVALMRLLVVGEDGAVFAVPRTQGRAGIDLPTAVVPAGSAPAGTLHRLLTEVLGGPAPTRLVGAVRNVVPPGTAYAWPAPVAHFCVHRTTGPAPPVREGVWLDAGAQTDLLSERHWWPLLRAELSSGPPPARPAPARRPPAAPAR
jgi:hypothetical protein